MAWLSGWQYRREIVIQEQSGSDLTDFQVKIELDGSNFDFTKANADGSDIRFTADDGTTLLSHWIEEWDSTNGKAVVWVKVPYIPANGVVSIYMYYGNPSATDASDGDATFDFFDDFDGTALDTNKWSENGTITVSVSNSVLTITADANAEGIVTVQDFDFTSIVVETKIEYVSGDYHSLGPAWKVDSSNPFNCYILNEWGTTDELRILAQGSVIASISGFDYTLNEWYIEQIIIQGDNYLANVFDSTGTKVATISASDSSLTGTKIALLQWANATESTSIDWVRVRKYADPEPTYLLGPEEQPWLEGWSFRRAITITEQSGSDLTDFQVKIELDANNFPDWDKVNADGSDLRFTADDGVTLLPYWIEEFDPVNQHAVIWVKVPSIPANGTVTIYMYYGNSEAVDASDGDAVFEFFDDFDGTALDTNKWNTYGTPVISIANSIVSITTSGTTAEGIYSIQTFSPPIILEAKIKHATEKDDWGCDDYFPNGGSTTNQVVSWYPAQSSSPGWWMQVMSSGTSSSTQILPTADTNWHIEQITWTATSATVERVGEGVSATLTTNVPTIALPLSVANWGSTPTQLDWVFVRKYASTDPAVSISTTREDAVILLLGKVTDPQGNPVPGAAVVALRQTDNVIDAVTYTDSDGNFQMVLYKYKKYAILAYPPTDTTRSGDIKVHIQT